MTKQERVKVIARVIACLFSLLCFYLTAKFAFWLLPQHKYLNIFILSLLAIDFALIDSGINKHGLLDGLISYFKRKR